MEQTLIDLGFKRISKFKFTKFLYNCTIVVETSGNIFVIYLLDSKCEKIKLVGIKSIEELHMFVDMIGE